MWGLVLSIPRPFSLLRVRVARANSARGEPTLPVCRAVGRRDHLPRPTIRDGDDEAVCNLLLALARPLVRDDGDSLVAMQVVQRHPDRDAAVVSIGALGFDHTGEVGLQRQRLGCPVETFSRVPLHTEIIRRRLARLRPRLH